MCELRVLVAKGTETESRSTINGQATSTSTIHAARDFAVVLTLAVNGDRLSRRVAREVRSSYARPGLQQTGLAPSAAAAQGVVTTTTRCAGNKITYKYHRVKGSVAPPPPSAGSLPCTNARHGAVNVPPRDKGPTAAGKPALIAVPRRFAPRGSRGMASPEAQMMANCPVIYFDDEEYDGDPPVLRLLRWSAEALALWLSSICGRRDPDTCDGPSNISFGGRANPHVSRAPYFPTP
jgi:hypothetical protein